MKRAKVALARKLATVLHRMWVDVSGLLPEASGQTSVPKALTTLNGYPTARCRSA